MTALLVPALLLAVGAWGLYRRVDVCSALCTGAKSGLKTAMGILPQLVVLLSAVYMLRASGALQMLSALFAPLFRLLGIPAETAALVFLRPVSGSGALAAGSELIAAYGADSYIGRCAAVMLGSTETTFYVVAVYFGSAQIRRTRHAVPAALAADLAGFAAAALSVRLFFPTT
ncbi:MAG: spore maturation protein [Oscillospiraceae bacterium]|nr:spore maturation protein [Oscillospiraceae bacterium]